MAQEKGNSAHCGHIQHETYQQVLNHSLGSIMEGCLIQFFGKKGRGKASQKKPLSQAS